MELILKTTSNRGFLCFVQHRPSLTAGELCLILQNNHSKLLIYVPWKLQRGEGMQPSHPLELDAVVGLQALYRCHQEIGFFLLSSFWCRISSWHFCFENRVILQKCVSFLCDAHACAELSPAGLLGTWLLCRNPKEGRVPSAGPWVGQRESGT